MLQALGVSILTLGLQSTDQTVSTVLSIIGLLFVASYLLPQGVD